MIAPSQSWLDLVVYQKMKPHGLSMAPPHKAISTSLISNAIPPSTIVRTLPAGGAGTHTASACTHTASACTHTASTCTHLLPSVLTLLPSVSLLTLLPMVLAVATSPVAEAMPPAPRAVIRALTIWLSSSTFFARSAFSTAKSVRVCSCSLEPPAQGLPVHGCAVGLSGAPARGVPWPGNVPTRPLSRPPPSASADGLLPLRLQP